ncbi:TonB-dependent receptor [Algibacillus agarilyticus]|uniref:TonB-dependent receptor n=1 Tax=Algibacillus agarilyticus TaxID=2234133 RepID=UPI000DCF99A0|nr:TonB-dependent receptor [Algibacillus agarilyticus]
MNNTLIKRSSVAVAIAAALTSMTGTAFAQEQEETEVIEVTGIRSALASALNEKRASANIKEVIQAEDIGKLPDQNLAEVLENITGIQITRTAGVGSGVQIRGTDSNRVEINGVSTVGSGTGRSGINFQDVPAALVAAVEVTKVPTAKDVEGSVGGIINLRTLRGLSLKDRLISVKAQGEHSDLAESVVPRLSGTFGDNWETDIGKVGVVLTGSYTRQDIASFNPRVDRDREVLPDSGRASAESFPFLRAQFFDQIIERYEYETKTVTGSLEYEPYDGLKFYMDMTLSDQESAKQNARAMFSGTGGSHVVDNTNNTAFETVDLGTIDGPNGVLNLGQVQVVSQGILGTGEGSSIDPNLRTASITGSRVTDSSVFALGSEWQGDKLKLTAEFSYSGSETVHPDLTTELDFINPNDTQPYYDEASNRTKNDNGVPIIFDTTGGTLQFGIAPGLAETPTTAMLLAPENYALKKVNRQLNEVKNEEKALRIDATYDVSDMNEFFMDVHAGMRFNTNSSERINVNSVVDFGRVLNRPLGNLFSNILTPGADNFNAADDRSLYVKDYLVIDPSASFNNPEAVISSINSAIETHNANEGTTLDSLEVPTAEVTSFFEIEEETLALYLQGDFDVEAGDIPIRGNVGVRYITTDVTSNGVNVIDDVATPTQTTTSHDYVLPRFNMTAEVHEDLLVRAGYAQDIRRANFNDLSTSTRFGGGAGSVKAGNPYLKPEEVKSFDLSAEYYLSDASMISVGLFHKVRSELHETTLDNPEEPIGAVSGQIERDVTAPCENGGIFNPQITDRGVWSSVTTGKGMCVPLEAVFNVPGDETQTGIELSAQYDLSGYESELGWASGFGVIANYTYQKAGSQLDAYNKATGDANALNKLLDRFDTDQSTATLDDDQVQERIEFLNLSENAYNITMFYDKYDLNVRMRYTWRSEFKTKDKISFDLPRIVADRAQLNMSVSYDISEDVTLGLEGVNLLREDRSQYCVNEGALFCAQGLTDRRVVFGVTAKM